MTRARAMMFSKLYTEISSLLSCGHQIQFHPVCSVQDNSHLHFHSHIPSRLMTSIISAQSFTKSLLDVLKFFLHSVPVDNCTFLWIYSKHRCYVKCVTMKGSTVEQWLAMLLPV